MEAEAATIPIALAEKRRLSCPLLALETGNVGELALVENADGVALLLNDALGLQAREGRGDRVAREPQHIGQLVVAVGQYKRVAPICGRRGFQKLRSSRTSSAKSMGTRWPAP